MALPTPFTPVTTENPLPLTDYPPQAANDTPSTGILDIAAELRVLIADQLDNEDMFNFRLANTQLRQAVVDRFIEEYSTQRRHLLEVHSLEVLKKITENRHLTHKLRKLVFVPAILGDWLACEHCCRHEQTRIRCEDDCSYHRDILGEKYDRERTAFELDLKGSGLLKACLSNLKSGGFSLELGVHEASPRELSDKRKQAYGQVSLESKLGIAKKYGPHFHISNSITTLAQSLLLVLGAVGSTSLGLAGLSFPLERCDDTDIELSDNGELIEKLRPSLACLQTFKLSIAAASPSLSRLSLRLNESGGGKEVRCASNSFPSNTLKEIEIASGELDPECDLTILLDKHKQSLRSLSITDTQFWKASGYFQWFAENLELDKFKAFELRFLGSEPDLEDEIVEGTEEVKETFLEMAEYLKECEDRYDEEDSW